jgi:hypothetical protein
MLAAAELERTRIPKLGRDPGDLNLNSPGTENNDSLTSSKQDRHGAAVVNSAVTKMETCKRFMKLVKTRYLYDW